MTWGNANDMANNKKQDIKFCVHYDSNFILLKIYIYRKKTGYLWMVGLEIFISSVHFFISPNKHTLSFFKT